MLQDRTNKYNTSRSSSRVSVQAKRIMRVFNNSLRVTRLCFVVCDCSNNKVVFMLNSEKLSAFTMECHYSHLGKQPRANTLIRIY